MCKNYKLKNGKYIKISSVDEGYNYSLYENNKKLIDGGIATNPSLNEKEAFIEILKILRIETNIEYQEIAEEIQEAV